ncbi:MAG TPA: aldo/keto reductase [Acidimicrobiales bacterium]|nr:aldo/keto reductase [Acidimicrobiales bacterium]
MTMPTRRIGSLEVSVVGLGCNNFGGRIDAGATAAVVDAALEAGITFFDTADIYGATRSEQFLGTALGWRRSEVVLATKFGMEVDPQRKGASPAYVRQALDDSLRRLGTDHIDLYQLHAPDPATPIAETLAALDEQVSAGKVRQIGCSNFSVEQLHEADQAVADGAARFVSVQNEFSILHRVPEHGVLAQCERSHVAFIPYFPLARGLLTGKYRRGEPAPSGTRLARLDSEQYGRLASEANLSAVEELAAVAEGAGRTLVELAIAWLAGRSPVASVIAGATSAAQVHANVAAADWVLNDDQRAQVDAVVAPGAQLV